jgi:hypothetical protein
LAFFDVRFGSVEEMVVKAEEEYKGYQIKYFEDVVDV